MARVLDALSDYSDSLSNTKSVGRRRRVDQEVGSTESVETDWEDIDLQANQVSARWVFRREVARRYRPAITVMNTDGAKFDVRVGFGSNAYTHIVESAEKAVRAYLDATIIKQQRPNPYEVGVVLARFEELTTFKNSLHEGYDGLNPLEMDFALELDELQLPWARNTPKTGFGIPLITTGSSVMFYPDFLLWSGDTVLCLETKGEHLVDSEAGRKLLSIVPNDRSTTKLEVRFISKGKRDSENQPAGSDGYTLWGLTNGQRLRTTHFEDLTSLVRSLVVQPSV